MQIYNPLSEDLDYILDSTRNLWEEMRGKRVFITGGTGFFGCWILESFLWATEKLNLQSSATVLTRNLTAFERKVPHLANNQVLKFITGDINSFKFPDEKFDFVIHAATDADSQVAPIQTIDTIASGTRRILEFSKYCKAKKLLLTSSGGIYGKQPVTLNRVSEDYLGAPDPMNLDSAYGEGKRMAELLCAVYAKENNFEVKIARCFAFVGPYLPLDRHFAVGNFIKNCLEGNIIYINGDGSPLRSYLYAADLAVWLWTILFRGKSCFPYNVGSEDEISIFDLAQNISLLSQHKMKVEVAQELNLESILPKRYVPSTQRAFQDLGLRTVIPLETALKKTIRYYNSLRK